MSRPRENLATSRLVRTNPAQSSVLDCFLFAKNNRSKSVWTLFQRKRLSNQTVWLFGLTGPICARALKSLRLHELRSRGHHDWPVKPTNRPWEGRLCGREPLSRCFNSSRSYEAQSCFLFFPNALQDVLADRHERGEIEDIVDS